MSQVSLYLKNQSRKSSLRACNTVARIAIQQLTRSLSRGISLGSAHFSIFFKGNFLLHSVPVDLDLLSPLLELFVGFYVLHLLQMPRSIGKYRIYMSLLLQRQFERVSPAM